MDMVFKDLKDLAKVRDSFEPESSSSDSTSIIKTTIPNVESKRNTVKDVKNKQLNAAKQKDGKIRVVLHPNFKSKDIIKEKFTNFLQCINEGQHCEALRSLYSVVEKDNPISDIPFHLDESVLDIRDRQANILHAFGVPCRRGIGKAIYRNKASRDMLGPSGDHNPVRFYFLRDGNKIEIILVDLYHLFATSKLDGYKKVYRYRICIKSLMT